MQLGTCKREQVVAEAAEKQVGGFVAACHTAASTKLPPQPETARHGRRHKRNGGPKHEEQT